MDDQKSNKSKAPSIRATSQANFRQDNLETKSVMSRKSKVEDDRVS